MNPLVKNELTSVSNWLGAAIGIIGYLLPQLTPQTLAALGFTGPWVQRISAAAALLLFVYREKKRADVLPPPTPEAARNTFVSTSTQGTSNAQATPTAPPSVPPAA